VLEIRYITQNEQFKTLREGEMQHVGLNTSQIKCGRVFARTQSYLPEVAQQGGVTGSLAPGHQQSLTIVGPVEVVDYAAVELCQLPGFASADRLIQYVESAVPREAVLHAVAVWRPE
jgi:hypothetical protein